MPVKRRWPIKRFDAKLLRQYNKSDNPSAWSVREMETSFSLQPPVPTIVVALFPEILNELVRLLSGLSAEEWQKPTVCAGWSVKDVALHLLGGEIGNLSRRRDGHAQSASISRWQEWSRSLPGSAI
jgi:hypothetical protein